jgi:flagellin
MAAILSTNMASLYAQKNLSTAQASLSDSVQRLSSGTRINSAKDDAAGYGIAESVRGTKNIVDQNIRNAKDGISWAQTAEGALDVVGKILQRALVLTTQKQDATLNTTQIAAINTEITALRNEINNITVRTKFQGGGESISVFGSNSIDASGNAILKTDASGNPISTGTFVATTDSSGNRFDSSGVPLAGGTPGSASNRDVRYGFINVNTGATSTTAANTVTGPASQGTTVMAKMITPFTTASDASAIQTLIASNATNRGTLGAAINSLEYAVDNMQTLSTNLADGISRIVDTDYAAETSNLTRTQILQQAATSMLAQANQMPNVILTLLK